MKKILLIYYSQTGQLKEISNKLLEPITKNPQVEITHYNIQPKEDFPFPWSRKKFFDVFPESFQQIPQEIKQPDDKILNNDFDLIILAYQIWFLSPSIPINSFLKSKYAQKIFQDKPVITVIGCRNMWAMSQEKMKGLLKLNKAKLVGNITFVDRHINHVSVVTIVHWMFNGKKNKKWGLFPKPGVSERDIKQASKFGESINACLSDMDFKNLQKKLVEKGAVNTKPFLILMDKKANKMFQIWSKFVLRRNKKRSFKLLLFNIYLFLAIWVISPIVYIFFLLTFPFRMKAIRKQLNYYNKV